MTRLFRFLAQVLLTIFIIFLIYHLSGYILNGTSKEELKKDISELFQSTNDIVDDFNHNKISYTNYNLQQIIDSAQNVIRDSIKNNRNVSFWSTYETGLPSGIVKRMVSYNDTEFKLDDKESTEYDYGIITIEKEDGSLVKGKIGYDWFLAIKINDIIQ